MSLRSLFIKEPIPRPGKPRTLGRIDRIPTHDLPMWADNCIYAIGRNLSDYAKDPSRLEMLDEAVEGSRALAQVLEAMRSRIG